MSFFGQFAKQGKMQFLPPGNVNFLFKLVAKFFRQTLSEVSASKERGSGDLGPIFYFTFHFSAQFSAKFHCPWLLAPPNHEIGIVLQTQFSFSPSCVFCSSPLILFVSHFSTKFVGFLTFPQNQICQILIAYGDQTGLMDQLGGRREADPPPSWPRPGGFERATSTSSCPSHSGHRVTIENWFRANVAELESLSFSRSQFWDI